MMLTERDEQSLARVGRDNSSVGKSDMKAVCVSSVSVLRMVLGLRRTTVAGNAEQPLTVSA